MHTIIHLATVPMNHSETSNTVWFSDSMCDVCIHNVHAGTALTIMQ